MLPAIEELAGLKQWVTWQYEKVDSEKDEYTKVPYKATGHASTTKKQTWLSYDAACRYAEQHGRSGIGFVFSADDGLVGIDLDDCIDEHGVLLAWAGEIVDRLSSYTEVSPSGHGLKIWVRGQKPAKGIKVLHETGHIEIYGHARYFTLTARRLDGTPDYIADCDLTWLYALVESLKPEQKKTKPDQVQNNGSNSRSGNGTDPYAAKTIEQCIVDMEQAHEGTRNETLNACAYSLGRLIAAGRATEAVYDDLRAAARQAGLSDREIDSTLQSGKEAGMQNPNETGKPETSKKPPPHVDPDTGEIIEGEGEEATEEQNSKPTIDITDEDLGVVTGQIWAAMQQSEYANDLYMYGDNPAYCNGRLKVLDRDYWRGMVNRVASFRKVTVTKRGPQVNIVIPPIAMVRDSLLFTPDDLPVIERMSPIPAFDRSGVLLEQGYHPDQRILVQSDIAITPMAPGAALALIDEMICDFPFKEAADRANMIAYLLTPFYREMCDHVPLFLIDASNRGTGKSLLNDLVHIVWTGEGADGGDLPLNIEEQRKQITTRLMTAPLSVAFDDVSLLQGHGIQRALTASTWSDRILGKNMVINVPVRAIFSATGNNTTIGGDMPRRVVLIRLEGDEENPSQRTGFRRSESELREWVKDNRAAFVSACIALVQHGLAHGSPGAIRMGGFDRFAKTASTILNGIGVQGFYENIDSVIAKEDGRQMGWKGVVASWWEMYNEVPIKASAIVEIIEKDETCEIHLDGDTQRARATFVGRLMKKMEGTVYVLDGDTRVKIVGRKDHKGKIEYKLSQLAPDSAP